MMKMNANGFMEPIVHYADTVACAICAWCQLLSVPLLLQQRLLSVLLLWHGCCLCVGLIVREAA